MVRRTDRQISEQDAFDILRDGQYGVLSTVSREGKPYGVPLNYSLVDGTIYFHSAVEGMKLDNIAHSADVSFCVVGATELLPAEFGTKYDSCIVGGVATEVFDAEKRLAMEAFVAKYSAGHEAAGARAIEGAWDKLRVFRISVESITGKARR